MMLPFTIEQFLDTLAAYNREFWPVVLGLWLATAYVFVRLLRGDRNSNVAISALLAVHWAWAGIAYHLLHFRTINPVALYFGVAFVLQAMLLFWRGVLLKHLSFSTARSPWTGAGIALVTYALLYPILGLLLGLSYPRMPTFGVPCPTLILTAGLLLMSTPREARWLAMLPLAWAVIGGSAAVLLDVRADFMLIVAGVALLAHAIQVPRPSRLSGQNISRSSS